MACRVFVIAGEASGDLHGANLIHALREADPSVEIHGVGGDRIRETGAKDFLDIAHFHVTGITDALKRYPDYKRAEKIILASVRTARPDAVVLIDNPGFNLHLAERIHAMGIPIAYYIAPQIWAWKAKRVFKIKRWIKKVLVVFDFEKKIYEDNGVPVAFVGHPLKDAIPYTEPAAKNTGARTVVLMPGSRKGELKMLFDIFAEAARLLAQTRPDVRFKLIKAPTLPKEFYARLLAEAKVPMELVETDAYAAIRSSDLVIACSGTATLECALLGTPMIIVNRGTLLTYVIAKLVVKVKYLGLPNLVLDKPAIPELLQNDATPERLAAEAERLLTDENARAAMKADLAEVSRRLGAPGAADRAAREVLNLLT